MTGLFWEEQLPKNEGETHAGFLSTEHCFEQLTLRALEYSSELSCQQRRRSGVVVSVMGENSTRNEEQATQLRVQAVARSSSTTTASTLQSACAHSTQVAFRVRL